MKWQRLLPKAKMLRVWVPILSAATWLALLVAPPVLQADITWQVHQTIEVAGAPIDMQLSSRGNWIFVLDDKGELLIYSSKGQYKDKIQVGTDVDQIKSGPRDDIVFLISRKKHTVQLISFAIKESIDTRGSPSTGPESAPVTIVVFSDFQCGYCSRLAPLLEQMIKQNAGKVKMVFKNFPLAGHSYSLQAAKAAMAAAEQGKFWAFHDQLFENYNKLNDKKIKEIAESLGLDYKKLQEEMKRPAIIEKIESDKQEGEAVGVNGTPTVFVNGYPLLNRSPRGIQQAIDEALNRLKK